MAVNSAMTHRSDHPVLIQSTLLADQMRTETAPEIPLSLLLSAPTPPLHVTDTRVAPDGHADLLVLHHP